MSIEEVRLRRLPRDLLVRMRDHGHRLIQDRLTGVFFEDRGPHRDWAIVRTDVGSAALSSGLLTEDRPSEDGCLSHLRFWKVDLKSAGPGVEE